MKEFRFALRQIMPILLSYLFIGIAAGLLLAQAGFAPVWALLSAFFVYAGSMQIVMVSLLTARMPLPLVAAMTFFLNARHIFYGLGFVEKFKKFGGWRFPYLALTMTDETYSVLCTLTIPPDLREERVYLSVQMTCHLLWTASCTLGAAVGSRLPFSATGIEFCATALFTTVVVEQWRKASSHWPAVIGLACAVLFYFLLGPDNFILPALSASVVALLFCRKKIEKEGTAHE